jgi:hypothetical protein
MAEKIRLPTYETLLTEAIRSLAVDSGTVTTAAAAGTNVLNDSSKNWANDIHKNRLVKIVHGAGAGQMAVIQNNTARSLVIKQSWTAALDATSVYVISDVDIASEFTALKEALRRALEVSEDSGTASGGSNTTIVDAGKNWAADMWAKATVHVIHDGVEYVRPCLSNSADTLTIAALPAAVSVAAGDAYAVRRPLTTADITDRTAREIGIVDSLRKWGGTALSGRDVSQDLARLDIALSALRDAITEASPNNKTLKDLYDQLHGTVVGSSQSPSVPAGATVNVDFTPAAGKVRLIYWIAGRMTTDNASSNISCMLLPQGTEGDWSNLYLARAPGADICARASFGGGLAHDSANPARVKLYNAGSAAAANVRVEYVALER